MPKTKTRQVLADVFSFSSAIVVLSHQIGSDSGEELGRQGIDLDNCDLLVIIPAGNVDHLPNGLVPRHPALSVMLSSYDQNWVIGSFNGVGVGMCVCSYREK